MITPEQRAVNTAVNTEIAKWGLGKWCWPDRVFLAAVILFLISGIFHQQLWPDSWVARLPVKASFASAEVVGEASVPYHDDNAGLVQISYASPAQKYQAIQKWHADFPDRWNRQIWADAEDGVLVITYVP